MSEMKNNWVKVRAHFCSTQREQISKSEDTAKHLKGHTERLKAEEPQ